MSSKRRRFCQTAFALCGALGALVLAAPGAGATTTVSLSGTTVMIIGDAEDNHITIGVTTPTITDPAGINVGPGCVLGSGTGVAYCGEYGFGWDALEAHLGDGDDRVTAGALSPRTAVVYGEGGDDELGVGSMDDELYGGDGDDQLAAGGGDDIVDGGADEDTIEAGGGNDTIDGGPGMDNVSADGYVGWEDGNDVIAIRDGESDAAQCGLGADRVTADHIDVIDGADCEFVDLPALVPAPPAPPVLPAPADTTPPALTLSDNKLTLDRRGVVRVHVTCPAGETAGCAGAVRLRSAKKIKATRRARPAILALGNKAYSAAAGTTVTVAVKPSAKARRAVRRARRLKVKLTVTARDEAHNTATVSRTVMLSSR